MLALRLWMIYDILVTNTEKPGFLADVPVFFLVLSDDNKVVACEAYKQAVLLKMLVIWCSIKKEVWLDLDEHMKMSTGTNNPYRTTVAHMAAHIELQNCSKNRNMVRNKGTSRTIIILWQVSRMKDKLTYCLEACQVIFTNRSIMK